MPAGGADDSPPLYLQTSPEFGMKRLLAAGAHSIFQVTRAFRQEETGRLHNPEFTIVEWYRVGATYREQMDFVEEVCDGFRQALDDQAGHLTTSLHRTDLPRPVNRFARPFHRLTYDEAFTLALGRPVSSLTAGDLASAARDRQIQPPALLREDDRDGWLHLLFVELVEPLLAERRAVFVYDYPASQAALARICSGNPPVAERFELFLHGIEICNGYQELTDPEELRRRFAAQSIERRRDGRADLPLESRLLKAMDGGLPECAGVALGFDRLLMTLLGASSLEEVIAFPFDRA